MQALDLLIADHNRVRGLFAQFKQAHESDDSETMSAVALKIFEDLEVHTSIEEEIFYPEVHDTDDEVGETVDEGLQEHHVVKVLMAEIKQLPDGDEEWVAKLQVLIENVEHHAEEEEKELFPPLRSSLSEDELEALGTRLEERKKQLGAPVLADKIDLTKEELLELARSQQIPGRSNMSQEELAATVAPA
ncbi:MAG: hemerythrin domain-containing protein [Acidimicrobiales bacterium]